jgi:hypothetical protein
MSRTPTHLTIAGQLHVLTSGTVLCTPFVAFPFLSNARPHEWNRAVHAIRSFSISYECSPFEFSPSSLLLLSSLSSVRVHAL